MLAHAAALPVTDDRRGSQTNLSLLRHLRAVRREG